MARKDLSLTAQEIDDALVWANGKYAAEQEQTIKDKFQITQSGADITRYTDTDATKTLTVEVICKYDNIAVKAANHDALISAGWTSSTTGKYSKTLTAASGTIAAQQFTYIKSGITCSRTSTAKSITAVNPAWYGWASAKNINGIVLNTAVRRTSAMSGDATIEQNTGSVAYLFILTKAAANVSVKQLGADVALDSALTDQTFTSPKNAQITMSGYRLYFTTPSFANGTTPKFTLNIPLA